jgi:RNA polymerase sigma factor (sigma-70 family)
LHFFSHLSNLTNLSTYTDDALVALLKDGDQLIFTEIYNRYWDKLFYVAYGHLKSSAEAEEIVQQVFLTLWNKKAQLDIQSLSVYLAAMTRYAVYKQLAKEKKKQLAESKVSYKENAGVGMEDSIDNKAVLELIKKLSHELPQKCRLVFIHNKLLDLPLEEVARNMNISIKTAEAHLTKALKIVRSKLGNSLSLLLL